MRSERERAGHMRARARKVLGSGKCAAASFLSYRRRAHTPRAAWAGLTSHWAALMDPHQDPPIWTPAPRRRGAASGPEDDEEEEEEEEDDRVDGAAAGGFDGALLGSDRGAALASGRARTRAQAAATGAAARAPVRRRRCMANRSGWEMWMLELSKKHKTFTVCALCGHTTSASTPLPARLRQPSTC
jgi:hypothetical protein